MVMKTASVGILIILFVAVLIGVTLLDPFGDQVQLTRFLGGNASTPSNVTGAASTIIGLLPLFFAIILMLAMVNWGLKG